MATEKVDFNQIERTKKSSKKEIEQKTNESTKISVLTDLVTNIQGKIRNLPNYYNEALMPVFEAVANSIQAIEDVTNIVNGEIKIQIIHDPSLFDEEYEKKIIGFEIVDNGIGFNEENFKSFCTSDSTYKMKKGCKGIGRFLWLKAFDSVEVNSIYKEENRYNYRKLKLNVNGIICDDPIVSSEKKLETRVKLLEFNEKYYKQPSAYKTTSKIAQRILEHCLSYFITNKAPNIIVFDEDVSISLKDLYKEIKDDIKTVPFKIKNHDFTLHHVKLYSTYNKLHNVVLCADHRDVIRYSVSKLIGTSSQIDTGNEKFVYAAYIESKYLDDNVNLTRLNFDFPEDQGELGSSVFPISLKEILFAIEDMTKKYLNDYIEVIVQKKKEIIDDYLEKDNPTLRAVAKYCPEIYNEIEPSATKEKIDETLYAYKGKAEYEIKKLGNKLLKTKFNSIDEIKDKVKDLEEKIEYFQKDQLASYIIFRKMIIELLKKKLELNKNGKYPNENIVHDIIFPRKTTTNDILFDEHNLWLIDEKLSFHSFAASDKPISEISKNQSEDRPDICIFSEIDEDNFARSVSLIEFKKPMRKKFDSEPTTQLLRYVRKINDKKILNPQGRVLLTNECTKYYCYAICDLNKKIEEFAENNNYSKLKNDLGYYFYNRSLNSHIEIIAFDKLVTDVNQRHRIFFEKLGI